jgi:hypothetical protein
VALAAENSSLTSVTALAAAVVNLATRAAVDPVTPTPPLRVEPGYLYE